MNKWEYKFVRYNSWTDAGATELLNEAGLDGWEATGHVRETTAGMTFLMKRPLMESTGDSINKEWAGKGHCVYFFDSSQKFCNYEADAHNSFVTHEFSDRVTL